MATTSGATVTTDDDDVEVVVYQVLGAVIGACFLAIAALLYTFMTRVYCCTCRTPERKEPPPKPPEPTCWEAINLPFRFAVQPEEEGGPGAAGSAYENAHARCHCVRPLHDDDHTKCASSCRQVGILKRTAELENKDEEQTSTSLANVNETQTKEEKKKKKKRAVIKSILKRPSRPQRESDSSTILSSSDDDSGGGGGAVDDPLPRLK